MEGSLEYKIQHTFYMQLIGLNLAAKLIFLLLCFGLNHEPNPSILKYLNISLLFFLFFFTLLLTFFIVYIVGWRFGYIPCWDWWGIGDWRWRYFWWWRWWPRRCMLSTVLSTFLTWWWVSHLSNYCVTVIFFFAFLTTPQLFLRLTRLLIY